MRAHSLSVPSGERDRLGRGVRRPAEHGLNRADVVSLGETPSGATETVALPSTDNIGMHRPGRVGALRRPCSFNRASILPARRARTSPRDVPTKVGFMESGCHPPRRTLILLRLRFPWIEARTLCQSFPQLPFFARDLRRDLRGNHHVQIASTSV